MSAIAKREMLPAVDSGPEALIAKAIEHNVPVETLERLLSMRDKLKQEQAREAFFASLSAFQAECPVIEKTKSVKGKDGKERYSFAPLDDIVTKVSPLLKKNGLSYTIKADFREGQVTAKCEVHHTAGHSETSEFSVPIEKEAYMNEAQKSGSAMSYAKRYAFCNAFGILTGDKDDDGQSLGDGVSLQDVYRRQAKLTKTIMEYYPSIMAIKDAIALKEYAKGAEAWFELSDEVKMALWVAPTKGGPFTTEERDVMKQDEWRQAYYGTAKPESYIEKD